MANTLETTVDVALPSDIDEIVDIERRASVLVYPNTAIGLTAEAVEAWDWNEWREGYASHMDASDSELFVVRKLADGISRVAGFALITMIERADLVVPQRRGHLHKLYVDPDRHRRGIGKTLVGAAENFTRRRGGAATELQAVDYNPATSFYEAVGYSLEKNPGAKLIPSLGVEMNQLEYVKHH